MRLTIAAKSRYKKIQSLLYLHEDQQVCFMGFSFTGLLMYTYINGTGVEEGVVFHQIDYKSKFGTCTKS